MASGNTLFRFEAIAGVPPSSAFAAIGRRNNHFVYNFDADTDESVDFTEVLSPDYAGGGITLTIYAMAATGTTGVARLQAQIERHDASGTDLDADSFATAISGSWSTPGTSGQVVTTTLAFTNSEIDSLAVNEHFRLRITRDANATSGTDSLTGDWQLLAVVGKET